MNLSPGFFPAKLIRRQTTIDPAQHFAVRVKGRYAKPISRHAFTAVMGNFNRQAAMLMRMAALGQEQARLVLRTGEPGEGARRLLHSAIERSAAIQSEFDAFIGPLIFKDHAAHLIVEGTKCALSQGDQDLRAALEQIEISLCNAPVSAGSDQRRLENLLKDGQSR